MTEKRFLVKKQFSRSHPKRCTFGHVFLCISSTIHPTVSPCPFCPLSIISPQFSFGVQHILGVTVTHQDMEAIDPDYYKNLLQITTLPLEDLGLDLTFSADTEMFGASFA